MEQLPLAMAYNVTPVWPVFGAIDLKTNKLFIIKIIN